MRSEWTTKSIARLRELWDQQFSARDIAKILNEEGYAVTRNAVLGKANRCGLQLRKPGTYGTPSGRK
jgi:hypothetical protein